MLLGRCQRGIGRTMILTFSIGISDGERGSVLVAGCLCNGLHV